jgi:hypothetical protein
LLLQRINALKKRKKRGLNIPEIAAQHFTVSIAVLYATTESVFDTSPVVMPDPRMTLESGMTAT